MLRSILVGAPIVAVVLLLRGADPTALAVPPTTVMARAAAVDTFTLPAPPPTDAPTTTTVAPTTTTAPPPPTEAPTTAPPDTAPATTLPTEAPAATAPPKPAKTTTTAETPPDTAPPETAPPETAPPETAPPETAPPAPVAIPGNAGAVIAITNQERAAAGLGPLAANGALQAAAQRQSNDMAANTTMSHTGSDGSTVGTRASAAGYSWSAIGENIAAGYTSAASVMGGWMNSAGHRANILNGVYQDIGVAVSTGADGKKYWTMVVGA